MKSKIPTDKILSWFKQKSWQPFAFQQEAWQAYLDGKSGLIHSSTGSGKTFAIWPAPCARLLPVWPSVLLKLNL